jgi:hypothetical protein
VELHRATRRRIDPRGINLVMRGSLTIALPSLPDGYSLDRLLWFRGRWILEVSVPIPNYDNLDDEPSPTVPVLMAWHAADQRWTLRKEDSSTDLLFMKWDYADDD